MNKYNCTLCKSNSSNKLILINGTNGKDKKLIVTTQTEFGEITIEYETNVEIKYCVSCGGKLPRLFESEEEASDNENNCKYCSIRDCLLSNSGERSMFSDDYDDGSEIKEHQIILDTNNCWETDMFMIIYEISINDSCCIQNRILIAPDYCPICGKRLKRKENRLFTPYHIPK